MTVIVGSDSQVVTVPANGRSRSPCCFGASLHASSIPILAAMAGGSGGSNDRVNAVPASFASTQLVINDFIVGLAIINFSNELESERSDRDGDRRQ